MPKTYVIGDIHGGIKALTQVLKRAPIKKGDTLVCLGDYVDGWSESGQTIDYLMDLEQQYNCVFVKGNHDVMLLKYLKTKEKPEMWLYHGGQASVDCYSKNTFDSLKHIQFIERLNNYHIDEENRLFVHAGFSSMHGPKKEYHETAYYWDRTLWETALSTNSNMEKDSLYYPVRFKLFNEIYIGHSSVLKFDTDKPMNQLNLWNLDTGAAYTGKLSIMDVDTKEVWQSDPVCELYPNEKGRNKCCFEQKVKEINQL